MGDSSDNVPGVKGIGPKGALALIQQFGTIDSVLEHASEVGPELGHLIRCCTFVPVQRTKMAGNEQFELNNRACID